MNIKIQDACTLLQVFDMNSSLKFYCDVLGFVVHQQAGPENDIGWVWLKKDTINLMLNTAYEAPFRPESPESARVDAHGDTCIYFSCRDINEVYQYLIEKGIKLNPPSEAPYGMKQLYLYDPDGFSLCFQWQV
ncbi:MAG: VOC family protein [Saprospiraceae bacterium]